MDLRFAESTGDPANEQIHLTVQWGGCPKLCQPIEALGVPEYSPIVGATFDGKVDNFVHAASGVAKWQRE